MATIGTLTLLLAAETSSFNKKMDEVNKKLGDLKQATSVIAEIMSNARESIAEAFAPAAIVAGIVTTTKALLNMVAATNEIVDTQGKLASRLGVSQDFIERLEGAFSEAEVPIEEASGAIEKFAKKVGEAEEGNESALESFAAIGLSIQDLNKMTFEQKFLATADAMSRLDTQAKKFANIKDMFGKGSSAMLQFFDLGEAGMKEMMAAFNPLSAEQRANFDKYDDAVKHLGQSWAKLQKFIGASIAPILGEMFDLMSAGLKFVIDNLDVIKYLLAGLTGPLGIILYYWKNIRDAVRGAGEALGLVAKKTDDATNKIAKPPLNPEANRLKFKAEQEAKKEKEAGTKTALEKIAETRFKLEHVGPKDISGLVEANKLRGKGVEDKTVRELEKLTEQLRIATEVEKASQKIQEDEFKLKHIGDQNLTQMVEAEKMRKQGIPETTIAALTKAAINLEAATLRKGFEDATAEGKFKKTVDDVIRAFRLMPGAALLRAQPRNMPPFPVIPFLGPNARLPNGRRMPRGVRIRENRRIARQNRDARAVFMRGRRNMGRRRMPPDAMAMFGERNPAGMRALSKAYDEMMASLGRVLTPFEEFTRRVDDLNVAYRSGMIDQEDYKRTLSDLYDKFQGGPMKLSGAMEVGSREAGSAIANYLSQGENDPQKKIERNTAASVDELRGLRGDLAKQVQANLQGIR